MLRPGHIEDPPAARDPAEHEVLDPLLLGNPAAVMYPAARRDPGGGEIALLPYVRADDAHVERLGIQRVDLVRQLGECAIERHDAVDRPARARRGDAGVRRAPPCKVRGAAPVAGGEVAMILGEYCLDRRVVAPAAGRRAVLDVTRGTRDDRAREQKRAQAADAGQVTP